MKRVRFGEVAEADVVRRLAALEFALDLVELLVHIDFAGLIERERVVGAVIEDH